MSPTPREATQEVRRRAIPRTAPRLWYIAATSREIGFRPAAVTRLGRPLVLDRPTTSNPLPGDFPCSL